MITENALLELYKTTLEEAQHRDRLYTQTWMAVAITGSVLVAALSFVFRQPLVISKWWVALPIALGLIFGVFFTNSIFRLVKEGDICRGIAREIEDALLTRKEQSGTERLICLLVRQKIDNIKQKTKCEYVKWVWRGQGWRWVYPGIVLVAWIAFCFFLCICIN